MCNPIVAKSLCISSCFHWHEIPAWKHARVKLCGKNAGVLPCQIIRPTGQTSWLSGYFLTTKSMNTMRMDSTIPHQRFLSQRAWHMQCWQVWGGNVISVSGLCTDLLMVATIRSDKTPDCAWGFLWKPLEAARRFVQSHVSVAVSVCVPTKLVDTPHRNINMQYDYS